MLQCKAGFFSKPWCITEVCGTRGAPLKEQQTDLRLTLVQIVLGVWVWVCVLVRDWRAPHDLGSRAENQGIPGFQQKAELRLTEVGPKERGGDQRGGRKRLFVLFPPATGAEKRTEKICVECSTSGDL